VIYRQLTDTQLASKEIVVIGHWPKAERTLKAIRHGDTLSVLEYHTKLVIDKVIHGNIKLGIVPIVYNHGIGWAENGSDLNSASSSLELTDIDVSKKNIWFLSYGRSWDKKDSKLYLTVFNFQCIQKPKLLPYFEVLRRPDRDNRIGICLQSRSPNVVDRALHYIAGDIEPWPIMPFYVLRDGRYTKKPRRLIAYADKVGQLAGNSHAPSRPLATALYAEIAGPKAVPTLRRLLRDRDPGVAAVAAGYLVRLNAVDDLLAFEVACRRETDTNLVCELIEAMRISKDLKYVPTLIHFLQDTGDGGSINEDIFAPPLYARAALKDLTSFTFPNDVAGSLRAWNVAKNDPQPTGRSLKLTGLLGQWDRPLEAKISPILKPNGAQITRRSRDSGNDEVLVSVRLTNHTRHSVTVPTLPTAMNQVWKDGTSSGGFTGYSDRKAKFVTIPPGASTTFTTRMYPSVVDGAPDAKVYLEYLENGRGTGLKVWMGVLKAQIAQLPKTKMPAP